MKNNAVKTYKLGQSIWLDNISRELLESGKLANMIEKGEIYGITSNPSIFNAAIKNSSIYNDELISLGKNGHAPYKIYEALAFSDIKKASDLFMPLYRSSNMLDGYVSLEIDPAFADDEKDTISEATRLWEYINRPNLMIKIPATDAGILAIPEVISLGINVNATLVFSRERYHQVMEAYIKGLQERKKLGLGIDNIYSVASFFISRIDTKVDELLNQSNDSRAIALLGKIAISNARLAYQDYVNVFSSKEFMTLNGNRQRPLWASTSVKNPDYHSTMYIDNLIGNNTVNTVPPDTLQDFENFGIVSSTVENDLDAQLEMLKSLEEIGVDLNHVTSTLEVEGVQAFQVAFSSMLQTIESKIKQKV